MIKYTLFIFTFIFGLSLISMPLQSHAQDAEYLNTDLLATAGCGVDFACLRGYFEARGGSCSWDQDAGQHRGIMAYGWVTNDFNCYINTTSYSANKLSNYTLQGISSTVLTVTNAYSVTSWVEMTPFLYLHNAPEGNVSVNISSPLDTYFPKPAFNQKNGWNVVSHNGQITLENEKVNHLFYELALKKMTLNRNGRNFASKDEVIAYLNNSDFLTKLGFSDEEKKNSLGYLIPEIQKASDTEYYYLTVLAPESIANISTLNITPKPNRIDRQYFAVYPTEVPVHTKGDFVFPKTEKEDGFTVKETGEFLIKPGMFVFFK